MTGKPSFLPSTNAIPDVQNRICLVHEVVKTRLERRRNLMKKHYDQKESANTAYSGGNLVMLRNSVLQTDESRKFHLPYCGPYCVVEVLPPVNYVIESLDGSTTKRVHFNRLKKSCGRINEKSTTEDDKFKKSSSNDWPNSDMGFCRRFSPSQSQLSRSHNINSRRPNLRPRSTLRRPYYYPDVLLHFDCFTALYEIVLHLGNFDIIESHHHELMCCRLFVILCVRIFLIIFFYFSGGERVLHISLEHGLP